VGKAIRNEVNVVVATTGVLIGALHPVNTPNPKREQKTNKNIKGIFFITTPQLFILNIPVRVVI